MIHGIYLKARPKDKWKLVSIAKSVEVANNDISIYLEEAKKNGNEKAEVISQSFESVFFIPEFINTPKEQKLMYN